LNRLTEDPADEQNPNYSPDGTQIAYKSAAPDPAHPDHAATRVWLMGDDGGNKAVLWPQGPDPEQNAVAWGLR
jgi:Tol biopolymer transport system component